MTCPKNRRKEPKRLKCLNFSIPHKFLHCFLSDVISKENEKNWTHNHRTYSQNFYQTQYDLPQELPKILREWTTTAENTYNWPFFILFEDSSMPTNITKQNKINQARNCMWHSYYFMQLWYKLLLDLHKNLGKKTQTAKNT